MTTDTVADADTTPGRALRRDTAVRSLAVAIVALALVACLIPGYRWWSRPDLFQDHGDAMGMDPAPVAHAARAAAVTFPDADTRDSATIAFHRATAVLSPDSARAKVSFYICRGIRAQGVIGYVHDHLATYCRDVRPITDGTTWTYPTRPGTTHLTRVDLEYALHGSHLFRRGTDSVRVDMTIRAS